MYFNKKYHGVLSFSDADQNQSGGLYVCLALGVNVSSCHKSPGKKGDKVSGAAQQRGS